MFLIFGWHVLTDFRLDIFRQYVLQSANLLQLVIGCYQSENNITRKKWPHTKIIRNHVNVRERE